MVRNIKLFSFAILFLLPLATSAQPDLEHIQAELQQQLDGFIEKNDLPGATLAVVLPEGELISLASGFADKERGQQMPVGGQMFTGSVGKTFVAALVLQLAAEGKLGLDDRMSQYLGGQEWYDALPNAAEFTIRQLLNHTSGLPRYVFLPEFLNDLQARPDAERTAQECLAFVANMPAKHPAGDGWGYSDTNYLLLGLLIEQLTGDTFYRQVQKRFLEPLGLKSTYPSTQRELPGLVQGYIGDQNPLSLPEKTIGADGRYAINPQFEWTGGGFVTNVDDLARWIKTLHEGGLVSADLYEEMINPAATVPGYGLGTFIWKTPQGLHYGHQGLFPGHVTAVEYASVGGYSLAVQVNTDQGFTRLLRDFLQSASEILETQLRPLDRAAVLANFQRQTECWNQGDIDCYMTGYWPSDSLRMIGRRGVTYGYEAILQNYRRAYPPDKMGQLHFDQLTLTPLSFEYYYAVGRYNLTYPDQEEPQQGWFSVLLRKIKGKWWMVSDHSS